MNHGVLQGFSSIPRDSTQKQYGAGIVTDPRHMPAIINYGTSFFKNGYSSYADISSTPPADFVSARITSTNRVNIASVSGSGGFITHILSHGFGGGVGIPTIFIAIDGIQYSITTTATLSGQRLVIGALSITSNPETSSSATYNVTQIKGLNAYGAYADCGHLSKIGKHVYFSNAAVSIIPSIAQVLAAGLPRLRFEKSFSIDYVTSTYNVVSVYDDSVYVGYVLD